MRMTPAVRRPLLLAHITCSVGWLGAVLAYLAVALDGRASTDPLLARAAFLSMERIGWWVIVPCCLGSLVTGLLHSLLSEWGLLKHLWVLAKLALTSVATIILLVHLRTALDPMVRAGTTEISPQLLVHPAGGLLVLLAATALSIWKPWGRTSRALRMTRGEVA